MILNEVTALERGRVLSCVGYDRQRDERSAVEEEEVGDVEGKENEANKEVLPLVPRYVWGSWAVTARGKVPTSRAPTTVAM